MKIATIISSVMTFLLLLSAMICGFWLKSGQPGSINFHINCGIASVVFCFITMILMIINFGRAKKGDM